MNKSVFIIAEAGVNHNGSVDLAMKMVDAAADAGVDGVKFQTFIASRLVSTSAPKARYQAENMPSPDTSQLAMLKRLELRFEDFTALKERCDRRGIRFMTTPFDIESADFADSLVDVFKIGSGDLDNVSFIKHIAAKGKPIILSTGMGSLDEVATAIMAIRASRPVTMSSDFPPLTILHCVSEYPCPFEHANLRVMLTLRERFGLPVGFSDHTPGSEASVAAVALGATMIEKHFTLDKSLEGPDHKASLDSAELRRMVDCVRNVEKALGDGVKCLTASELDTKRVVRKVVVAARPIEEGEILGSRNMTLKRAESGVSASQWDEMLGKKAHKSYAADEPIEPESGR